MNMFPNRFWTAHEKSPPDANGVVETWSKPKWSSHEPDVVEQLDRQDLADEYDQRMLERRGLV